jgi:RHS repeat-associated protein
VATNDAGQSTASAAIAITVRSAVAKIYYIHVDHLSTPRLIADKDQKTVWRWDQQEPFGVTVPDGNPSGVGAFEFPLRFPGQYADKETDFHHNYFRDYVPSLGRYAESDPAGLNGGINTYAYVSGNPVNAIDVNGLLVQIKCRPLGRVGRAASEFIFKRPQRHCFIYVACPEEDWATVLSFQGNIWPLPVFTTGRKVQANPLAPVDGDDPFSSAMQTETVTPKKSCPSCAYEKEIVSKFNKFPKGDVPYDELGPNSNTFVNYLVTSTLYGATVPYGAIPNAPGLSDSAPGSWMR